MGLARARVLREAAWAILAAATLMLWSGHARGACDLDLVEAMWLEAWVPPSEESTGLPAARLVAWAAAKPRTGAAPPTHASGVRAAALFTIPVSSPEPPRADDPWRPYCARSARLLR